MFSVTAFFYLNLLPGSSLLIYQLFFSLKKNLGTVLCLFFLSFLHPLDIFSFQGSLNCMTVYVNLSSPVSNCFALSCPGQWGLVPRFCAFHKGCLVCHGFSFLIPAMAWNVMWKSYKVNKQSFKLNTILSGSRWWHRTLAHFCLRMWVITSSDMPALCRLSIY